MLANLAIMALLSPANAADSLPDLVADMGYSAEDYVEVSDGIYLLADQADGVRVTTSEDPSDVVEDSDGEDFCYNWDWDTVHEELAYDTLFDGMTWSGVAFARSYGESSTTNEVAIVNHIETGDKVETLAGVSLFYMNGEYSGFMFDVKQDANYLHQVVWVPSACAKDDTLSLEVRNLHHAADGTPMLRAVHELSTTIKCCPETGLTTSIQR